MLYIDASIAAGAESELLYDRPYEDKKTVRVAGPFTVESLSVASGYAGRGAHISYLHRQEVAPVRRS